MGVLTDEQNHGVLVFDDILLRESFNVNSQALTYSGAEDFGGEIESSGFNSALVYIFQSLALNFPQSIAVFDSRGPAKGT